LKKDKVKYNFAVKSKEELDRLSHEELLNYVKNLQDNLIQEKPPKNSNNSSIPSSIEIANPKKKGKNQSLRQKSDRLAGGQKGRVGVTLNQSDTPDEIEEIPFTIASCKKCGESLTDTVSKLKERRQVLDIKLSSIDTQIKEYQSFSKICSVCGYDNHDNSFTKGITPNISYGSNITAMVSYLSVSQYMAHKRIVSLLSDLFNINIAEGTINSLLKKASKLSQTEIQKITTALESASLVGIDETGCKINSSKHWHWTFQNTTNTLVVVDKSRGTKVINKTFGNGFKNACVVHDNYSSYSSLECKSEQLCLAHKMRDLNYAIDCDDTMLAKAIKKLFKEAIKDDKEELTQEQRVILKAQYDKTLEHLLSMPTLFKSETQKQVKSITKAKDKIFTFLLDEDIPADNNGSERAIRNIKVKQKVSTQFKSFEGAVYYSNIRSIIDTSRKRGLNEFESLTRMIEGYSLF
jgi:hypothetical protein